MGLDPTHVPSKPTDIHRLPSAKSALPDLRTESSGSKHRPKNSPQSSATGSVPPEIYEARDNWAGFVPHEQRQILPTEPATEPTTEPAITSALYRLRLRIAEKLGII